MKRLIALAAVVVFALTGAYAQQPPLYPQLPPLFQPQQNFPLFIMPPEDPSPVPEEYESYLKRFNRIESSFFRTEWWKDLKLVDKNKQEKKFSELSTTEQQVFILDQAVDAEKMLKKLTALWELELASFDKPGHKLVKRPKSENPKQNPAVKSEVKGYLDELLVIRKKFAAGHEKFAEEFLSSCKLIGDKERIFTLDQIRKSHDKENLVDRKGK